MMNQSMVGGAGMMAPTPPMPMPQMQAMPGMNPMMQQQPGQLGAGMIGGMPPQMQHPMTPPNGAGNPNIEQAK